MIVRPPIRQITSDLASNSEEVLQEATTAAKYLIEKATIAFDRLDQTDEAYRGLIKDDVFALSLTRAEFDAIVQALMPLLTGPPVVAAWAASALQRSARLELISPLTSMIRRVVTQAAWPAYQGIITLSDVMIGALEPNESLSLANERLVEDACSVLRFAERDGVQGVPDVREAAVQARRSISRHLRRHC